MSCSATLSGIVRDCASNAGGIKELYIANADDVASIALDSTGEKVQSITMATGKKFKKFYFKTGQANVVYTPQFNDAAEYAGEDGILSVNFSRQDTTKRVQIHALSIAELIVIYKDNNGINWLMGYDHPVLRNGGDTQTGAAHTDTNRYALQLHSTDNQLPYEVTDTILGGITD